MKGRDSSCIVDQYLIARVEGCINGATAHDMHKLVAVYEGLCRLSTVDASARARVPAVEARLRRFCRSAELHRVQTEARSAPGACAFA